MFHLLRIFFKSSGIGIGFNGLTLAPPVFPVGTQILENNTEAIILVICPNTSIKLCFLKPTLSIHQWECNRGQTTFYKFGGLCWSKTNRYLNVDYPLRYRFDQEFQEYLTSYKYGKASNYRSKKLHIPDSFTIKRGRSNLITRTLCKIKLLRPL
jgi:hypothetical protein